MSVMVGVKRPHAGETWPSLFSPDFIHTEKIPDLMPSCATLDRL